MSLEKDPLVLVVASDVDTLTSLYPLLEKEGCLVATRRRVIEGLKYVADHKPEIAIVGGDGLERSESELARRIREISPRTRVLRLDRSRCDDATLGRLMETVHSMVGRTAAGARWGPDLES